MNLKKLFPLLALLGTGLAQAGNLQNYGPETPVWKEKLQKLHTDNQKFRIVQIGDSHTAGDFFTHQLRTRLQQQWGNGGIGWVYPNTVKGQRMATVRYRSYAWPAVSSRSSSGDFPLGGVTAYTGGNGSITVSADDEGMQNIAVFAKPVLLEQTLTVNGIELPAQNSGWQVLQTQTQLPLTISSPMPWSLGFINIENRQSGVTLSAMGINGSQLSQWSKWRTEWPDDLAQMQPDLVILAYGTNEAFNDTIDIAQTEQLWQQRIQTIQNRLPQAGIVIVGAPESLKGKGGSCGTRPARLDEIQAMQQRVARQQNVLFWSWEAAMGGKCSMKPWMNQGLSAKDGVHFSAKGYQRAADNLADNLIDFVR
ncbi:SGNH/GDSL hydrolase family protein [Neisseria sp. ZJ106]|uniref:SGNH/GDSL hydrolase family protein n=1 Tax=Neisseria lisongii TaxID=2912188 RepID=A0ABY7RI44_9NEIS|nr:SGNH/GDSL hydrolase family protein [Neisseria lisongii]MCF7522162.1 SGNH/GDSL hydrolase family protein [Neisseria lisongii]WCL71007.1 SGNH/GDSL hydrolase family protein [Neisseria lisongii]